jgi:hypothetical protein
MRSQSTRFSPDNTVAFAKRFKLMIFAIVALATPALGQDKMVLGPRQFEHDNSGKGAVLCSWSILLSIQAQAAECGLARRPGDDAIDQAIAAIDEFILKNSSLRPTRQMLDDFKRRAAESQRNNFRQRGDYCDNPFAESLRSSDPNQLRAGVQELLSIEREPTMSPCL